MFLLTFRGGSGFAVTVLVCFFNTAIASMNSYEKCRSYAELLIVGGQLEQKVNKSVDGVKLCELAMQTSPDDGDLWAGLARAYFVNDQQSKSLEAISRAVKFGSGEGAWLKSLINNFGTGVEVNKFERGVWARKAAELGYGPAQHYLGWLLISSGTLNAGEEAREEIVSQSVRMFHAAVKQGYQLGDQLSLEKYTSPEFIAVGDDFTNPSVISEFYVLFSLVHLLSIDESNSNPENLEFRHLILESAIGQLYETKEPLSADAIVRAITTVLGDDRLAFQADYIQLIAGIVHHLSSSTVSTWNSTVKVDETVLRSFTAFVVEAEPEVQKDGLYLLATLFGEGASELLLNILLNDREDVEHRVFAANLVASLGDSRAFEPIASLLNSLLDSDTISEIRNNEILFNELLRALYTLDDERVVDLFITLLVDNDVEIRRYQAMLALLFLNDPRAIEPIFAQLIKEDYDFVDNLGINLFDRFNAIEFFYEAMANDRLEIKLMAFAAFVAIVGDEMEQWYGFEIEPYINAALEILKSASPSARHFAVQIIAEMHAKELIAAKHVRDLNIESLIHHLAILVENDNIYCDVRLDYTTNSNENPQNFNSLIELSTHSSWLVRLSAVRELGDIDDPQVVESLEAATHDKNACVRSVAVRALANLSNNYNSAFFAPGTYLTKMVRSSFNKLEHPESVVSFLSYIGDSRAVVPLISFLYDEDPFVRRGAAKSLGELKDVRAVEPLIALLEDENLWVVVAAATALAELGEEFHAVEPLIALLEDENHWVVVAATTALAELGEEFHAVEPLIAMLHYEKYSFLKARIAIVEALGELKDARAVEPLIALLYELDVFQFVLVGIAVVEALGELKDARAVEVLIELLDHNSDFIRFHALLALGKLKDARAVEPVVNTLLKEVEDHVTIAAAAAIAELGEELHAVDSPFALPVDRIIALLRNEITAILPDEEDKSKRFTMVQILRQLRASGAVEPLVLDPWGELNVFIDEAVSGKMMAQSTTDNCKRWIGDYSREWYRLNLNGLLFCTHLIAERGSYFARIDLLHQLWGIKKFNSTGIESGQVDEELMILERSIDSIGGIIQPYTYLAIAILSGNEAILSRNKGQFLNIVEWTDKGLSGAADGEILVRVALSIVKAEALVVLGRSKESLKVLESIEAFLPAKIPVFGNLVEFLPKLEILMTKVFILSNLKQHHKTIEVSDEAEHLLKIYTLWGWTDPSQSKKLFDARIASMLAEAYSIEGQRYARRAWIHFNEHRPVGIQETYGYQLSLSQKIEAALESGEPEKYKEAYKAIEKFQLESMPLPSELRFADEDRNSRVREYISIEQEVNNLVRERNKLKGSNRDISKNERDQLNKQFREKKAELERFVIKLKTENPYIAARWARAPTDFVHLQQRLDSETAILQFLVLDQESYAFLFRNSGAIEIAHLKSESRIVGGKCPEETDVKVSDCFSLEDSVLRYKSLLRRESKTMPREYKDEMNNLGEKISKVLLHSFKEAIDEVEHLVIVPNGVLHHLPWSALPWKDGYLVEHKLLTILPATSLFGAVTALSQEIRLSGLLALGDPIINEKGWSKLPSSRHEVEKIVAQFPDSLPKISLLGEKATRDAVIERDLRGYILHFATHAESASPQHTRLLLTNGDLTYNDILTLNIKNAPVVVLSACRTGIGELLSGDHMYSLADAFLSAQAQSVVYSIWLVDDASTATLMTAFYESFNQVADSSRALAQAQRTMIEKGFLPKHWAGFVVSRWTD